MNEVKDIVAKRSGQISPNEVKAWFGKSRKSKLGHEQYNEIAAGLNRLRWPSDPSSDANPQQEISGISKDFWDFDAVTKASKVLLANVPAMLSHWKDQRSTAETRSGCEAIKTLGSALSDAMFYIEWPFGPYKRPAENDRRIGTYMPS